MEKMMRLGLFVMCVLLAGNVLAAERRGWQPGETLPQNRPLPVTLAALEAAEEELYSAGVLVNVGLKNENPTWGMTQTVLPVMVEKLLGLPAVVADANDALSMKAPYGEPTYKGLEIRIQRMDGKPFETLYVYNGAVRTKAGIVAKDPGRRFEYWVWGTARVKREVVMGARIMPVLTFEQCRLMGQEIVDSLPRQCLLPDGDILLDVKEPLTSASLKATDFDGCLRHGVGIINTFPRRCVVPGGRVFVEPPRVIETPADAPLAEGVNTGLPVNVTPTTVPVSTTVVVPGVGNFTISSTAEAVGKVLAASSTVLTVSDSVPGVSSSLVINGGVPVTATVVVPGVSVTVDVTGTMVVSGVVPLTSASSILQPSSELGRALDAMFTEQEEEKTHVVSPAETRVPVAPGAKKVENSLSDIKLGN